MRNVARFLITGWLFVGCLAVLPAAAQRGGGGHGGGGGGFHGGGGGGFHSSVSGGFRGGGYGGFRGGYGGYGRGYYGRGFYGRGYFGFGLGFYPYSYWPYYYDYGYPYGYPYDGYGYSYPYSSYDYGYGGYGYSSAPAMAYQSDPAPQVYDPPRAARPEVREYSPGPSAHSNEKPIYLLAFKNQDNIRAAEAYWVTGGTLHFITLQHEQRQAPLDSVDQGLTNRLNHERHVNFYLPATD